MIRVLLLAGTAEARELAEALATWDVDVTVSLAGATRAPVPLPGRQRRGGFGGADGLSDYLRRERIDVVVDATHPFAAQMSANAARAAAATGRPLLHLARPAWEAGPADRWHRFPDLATALVALPPGARPFLAIGAGGLATLGLRPDLGVLLRSIDPIPGLPPQVTHVRARPPFETDAEAALFRRERVTHLVVRNAGGASGRSKLDAAAALGLPVLMIDRPPPPEDVPCFTSTADLLAALRRRLPLDTASGRAP